MRPLDDAVRERTLYVPVRSLPGRIASGRADFSLAAGFASNGYGVHSPGGYSLAAALVCEVVMTFMFLLIILGATGTLGHAFARACDVRGIPYHLLTRGDVDIGDAASIDALVLECNHDLDMLKVGPYPWSVKQRVMSRVGHLSNLHMSDYLTDDLDSCTANLILGHLSEQNNHPAIVQLVANEALERRGLQTRLSIATQQAPGEVFQF